MWRHAVIGAALFAATWIVFWRTCSFEFVNFDDLTYTVENPAVRGGLNTEGITWALTEGHKIDGNWMPLTWLSLTLDAHFHGINAGGFHFTNVLLHALNSVLLYWVLQSMTAAPWRSGLAAALFAVHPLHVESVAWVAERKDVLSTFFGLLAIAVYVRYAQRPARHESGRIWYLFALVLFVASLMSKQMLVTLPCVLLLLDYWPLRRVELAPRSALPGDVATEDSAAAVVDRSASERAFPKQSMPHVLAEKLPFLLLSVVFSTIVFFAQRDAGNVSTLTERPLATRSLNAVTAYAAYLRKTVWPDDLAIMYPYPAGGISAMEVALSGLLLLAIAVIVLWQARRSPYLLVGWLWFLGTLVPVIGLVQVGDQRMADRYTYVPLIGIFVAVAWSCGVMAARSDRSRIVVCALAAAALAGLAVVSVRQVSVWQNSETLFVHALAVTRDNATAHVKVAGAYSSRGEEQLAIEHLRSALKIRPQDALAHYSLGVLAERQDRDDDAERHYRQSIEIEPQFAAAHTNLAVILDRQGQAEAALEHYRLAVAHDPADAQALFNLAVFWQARAAETADAAFYEQAEPFARTAASLRPADARCKALYGDILLQLRRFDDAARQFALATSLDSDLAAAHEGLGIALFELRRFDEALVPLTRAYEIAPTSFRRRALTEGYNAVARDAFASGDFRNARSHLERLLEVDPDSARGHLAFGRVCLRMGDRATAQRHAETALQLDPELAEARELLESLRGQ